MDYLKLSNIWGFPGYLMIISNVSLLWLENMPGMIFNSLNLFQVFCGPADYVSWYTYKKRLCSADNQLCQNGW